MKLTHEDLIKLGTLLGHDLLDDGLCKGFSCMWAQAVLARDEAKFFERLDFIAAYNPDFAALEADIRAARNKVKNGIQLNENDLQLLEIPAFFDGITLFLNPAKHLDVFDTGYIPQTNLGTIYPLARSKALEHRNLHILLNKAHIFDKNSLKVYLNDLKWVLKDTDLECPVLLSSVEHNVCLRYDKIKQKWRYIDTNYLTAKTYFRELETSELVSSIFESLSDPSAKHVQFNMEILSANNETAALNSFAAALKKFDLRYPVTPELATFYDHQQAGLLYLACQNGHLAVVKELLKYPQLVINKTISNDGETPLYMACGYGRDAIVAELLKHPEIAVNQAKYNGVSPLYTACAHGHDAVVATLLKNPKIEVNQAANNGATPLSVACKNGHDAVVATLLKNPKIAVNQAKHDGATPLYMASEHGHHAVVANLLKHPEIAVNQAVNKRGETPLFAACQNGHPAVVAELLKHPEIRVNQTKYNGVSPLFIACLNGHAAVVAELLKHPQLAINQPVNNGVTPLYIACQEGHVAVVKLLLDTPGIAINALGLDNNTPLLVACLSPHTPELFELLLQNKASLTHQNKQGQTALDIAVEQNNSTAIAVLLKFLSRNPIALEKALFLANSNGNQKVLKILSNLPGTDSHVAPDPLSQKSHAPEGSTLSPSECAPLSSTPPRQHHGFFDKKQEIPSEIESSSTTPKTN